MVAIKFLLGLAVLVFLVTFAVKNMEPQVTIDYYFGYTLGPLPFFFALLAATVLGALITTLFSFVEYLKLGARIRRQGRQIASLEQELLNFKKQLPEPQEEPRYHEPTEEPPEGPPEKTNEHGEAEMISEEGVAHREDQSAH